MRVIPQSSTHIALETTTPKRKRDRYLLFAYGDNATAVDLLPATMSANMLSA